MEATRCSIRDGRRLASDGQFVQAVEVWKEALVVAYSDQDFASMFVLSKNVGKACRHLASQSKEPLSLLQEALEHFDYALGVINQCSLRDVLGGYKALYCSVRRVEMERERVVKQMEGIQAREEESEQVETTKRLVECTTCCGNSEEMVLDENDGCYYCQTCYEEYYAAERGTKEEVVSELRIERKESWKEAGASGDNREYEEGEKNAIDEEGEKEDAPAGVEPSLDEPKDQEEAQERLRHSRVELGSLADFLAGAVRLEEKQDEAQTTKLSSEQKVETSDEGENVANTSLISAAPTALTVNRQEDLNDATTAIFTDDSSEQSADALETCIEEYQEAIVTAATGKTQYSIAELLEFRNFSASDCPEVLLTSPVRDDGTDSLSARNKVNSRRKANMKKTMRSPAIPKHNKTESASNLRSSLEEEAGGMGSESLLPPLDLCTAMRTVYQEHRASCSKESESAMEELAVTLSDSKESPPFATQARILSHEW